MPLDLHERDAQEPEGGLDMQTAAPAWMPHRVSAPPRHHEADWGQKRRGPGMRGSSRSPGHSIDWQGLPSRTRSPMFARRERGSMG
jgi:hypothetical protein